MINIKRSILTFLITFSITILAVLLLTYFSEEPKIEMKPTYRSKEKTKLMDVSSRASLHSKIYIFDRKHVFVGSYNLDPRSTRIKTEMGIYVTNTEMAEIITRYWEKSVGQLAFKLSLQHAGDSPRSDPQLLWTDTAQDPVKVYDDEPLVGSWEKIQNSFYSIFPIEGQL